MSGIIDSDAMRYLNLRLGSPRSPIKNILKKLRGVRAGGVQSVNELLRVYRDMTRAKTITTTTTTTTTTTITTTTTTTKTTTKTTTTSTETATASLTLRYLGADIEITWCRD